MSKIILETTHAMFSVNEDGVDPYRCNLGEIISNGNFRPRKNLCYTLEDMKHIIGTMIEMQGSE